MYIEERKKMIVFYVLKYIYMNNSCICILIQFNETLNASTDQNTY